MPQPGVLALGVAPSGDHRFRARLLEVKRPSMTAASSSTPTAFMTGASAGRSNARRARTSSMRRRRSWHRSGARSGHGARRAAAPGRPRAPAGAGRDLREAAPARRGAAGCANDLERAHQALEVHGRQGRRHAGIMPGQGGAQSGRPIRASSARTSLQISAGVGYGRDAVQQGCDVEARPAGHDRRPALLGRLGQHRADMAQPDAGGA